MAFYISITKTFEDPTVVRYRFEGDGRIGSLTIAKATGEVALDAPVPGDENGHYFSRAAAKLRKHWNHGEFPEHTAWAS